MGCLRSTVLWVSGPAEERFTMEALIKVDWCCLYYRRYWFVCAAAVLATVGLGEEPLPRLRR